MKEDENQEYVVSWGLVKKLLQKEEVVSMSNDI